MTASSVCPLSLSQYRHSSPCTNNAGVHDDDGDDDDDDADDDAEEDDADSMRAMAYGSEGYNAHTSLRTKSPPCLCLCVCVCLCVCPCEVDEDGDEDGSERRDASA